MTPRRIVLVGFMGSGKTVVGAALAQRLGWTHVDLDREIERRAGATVDEIFGTRGEPAFRALEREVTPDLVRREKVVLSTGGGWVTNEGVLETLPGDSLTVWLEVSPAEVLRRVEAGRGQAVRPLLRAPDPRERIEQLLAARQNLYRRADVTVSTDGKPVDAVVETIVALLRGQPPATSSPS